MHSLYYTNEQSCVNFLSFSFFFKKNILRSFCCSLVTTENKSYCVYTGNFLLKTHDFLQPLDQKPGPPPLPASAAESRHRQQQVVHALPLPGGVGTFSISPAPVSVALPAAAVVKSEPPFVLWGQPAATLQPGARGTLTTQPVSLSFECSLPPPPFRLAS
jgi:hypothetical protein